jgi:hypothetical protein
MPHGGELVDPGSDGRDRRSERQPDDNAVIVLFVWLMWFAITCVLTLAGIVVVAGAGIVYLAGRLLAVWKPDAGRATMAAARFVFALCVELVDLMNGHKPKQPAPTVVIHTIHTAAVASPAAVEAAPQPSKAQQIADAKAAYAVADLIDSDDSVELLEQRIGAIVGVERPKSAP